jgi:hypothetical protein
MWEIAGWLAISARISAVRQGRKLSGNNLEELARLGYEFSRQSQHGKKARHLRQQSFHQI